MPKSIYDGGELGQAAITGVKYESVTIVRELEPDLETNSRRWEVAAVINFINGKEVTQAEANAFVVGLTCGLNASHS